MKTSTSLLIFFIVIHLDLSAQELKFEEVTKLPSTINSDAEESMPLVFNNGKSMFFVRSFYKGNRGGKFAGQDIWFSNKSDSAWSTATNHLGLLNNKKNNAIVGIGQDGKTLYLLDSYGGSVHGIAFSRFINEKWTKPEKIPIKGLSKDGYVGFYMNPSYDVLLVSMKKQDSYGIEDLYICLKDSSNQWSAPKNLGPTINTKGFEISPFLTEDKKFLFFASNGHPGFGDADIFVSQRLYNSWDIWSVPNNLGPVVNSTSFDAYFSITKDSVVYFSSNKESNTANIYRSAIIEQEITYSQARIDSIINEANSLLNEIKSAHNRNTKDLLFLFEYNKFELDEIEMDKIDMLLDDILISNQVVVQLLSFSFEDYQDDSKNLIVKRREQNIREYLIGKGLSTLDILTESYDEKEFSEFRADNIGGIRIKISY